MTDFPVWVDIPVRFRDTDAMRHVNNAVYVTYLEVGRQTYWSRFTEGDQYESVPFVVAHLSLDLRSPAKVGEVVRVHLRTTWISRSSFGMEYELRDRESGRLLVQASSIQVTFDYTTDKSMPLPDEVRAGLESVEGGPLPGKPVSGND